MCIWSYFAFCLQSPPKSCFSSLTKRMLCSSLIGHLNGWTWHLAGGRCSGTVPFVMPQRVDLQNSIFACVLCHGNDGITSFPGADKDMGVFLQESCTTATSRVFWNQLKWKINQKDAFLNRIRCQNPKLKTASFLHSFFTFRTLCVCKSDPNE